MRLGHLSDLHLRSPEDLGRFDAQLGTLSRAAVDHLVLTGDLLERWDPRLLDGALDVLRGRGFFHRDRLTIIHGNHDIASVGAPHSRRERRRMLVRFWDPEALLRWRTRRFYARVAPLFDAPLRGLPACKIDVAGLDLYAIDTVPTRFRPIAVNGARIELRHAIGTVRDAQARWLATRHGSPARPRVLLIHHYPLATPPLTWRRLIVPMEIPAPQRDALWTAIRAARVSLVLCGHVHRSRVDEVGDVRVALEGTSGGAWAQFGASVYEIGADGALLEHEKHAAARGREDIRRAV